MKKFGAVLIAVVAELRVCAINLDTKRIMIEMVKTQRG
jgi:hypothetical protein